MLTFKDTVINIDKVQAVLDLSESNKYLQSFKTCKRCPSKEN